MIPEKTEKTLREEAAELEAQIQRDIAILRGPSPYRSCHAGFPPGAVVLLVICFAIIYLCDMTIQSRQAAEIKRLKAIVEQTTGTEVRR